MVHQHRIWIAATLIPDDVRNLSAELGSIWAIELLIVLRADPTRTWSAEELVLELRASGMVVGELLPRFKKLGLIDSREAGRWSWRTATAELESLSEAVAKAYSNTPVALIKAALAAPKNQISLLADAFKLKDGK